MDGYNNSLIDDLKREFSNGSMVNRLVIANLTVFLFLLIGKIFMMGLFQSPNTYSEFMSLLAVPQGLTQLAYQPWSILTYMFVHDGFFPILWNLLLLYWFGRIFVQIAGNERVLPLYVMGGIAGAIFYITFLYVVPGLAGTAQPMIGATSAVMAIVVATAAMRPNYSLRLIFLGAVKLKWIALVMVIIDLFSVANMSYAGGSLAHLGGASIGLLFGLQLNNGTDISEGFANFFEWIGDKFKSKPEPKPQPTIVYKNTVPPTRKRKRAVVQKNDVIRQAKVDAILDKIKEVGGYDNLSPEEKEYLFRASKED